ncbi:hypothetical protein A2U01_0104879, partial [Trifolium medium]|nr:hypothetical protein [Trifolium medium]
MPRNSDAQQMVKAAATGAGLPTTSFSMPLHNVSDDIGNGELHSHEPF